MGRNEAQAKLRCFSTEHWSFTYGVAVNLFKLHNVAQAFSLSGFDHIEVVDRFRLAGTEIEHRRSSS